jgi:hypothetical protein
MSDQEILSRYDKVILALYMRLVDQYGPDLAEYPFDKEFLDQLAKELRIKNIPDIIYSYRSGRRSFPSEILKAGYWVIRGKGKGKYVLVKLDTPTEFYLPHDLESTPIPDATPEIVLRFAKGDEQSILAQIRYNRLVDIFTGLTAYHLQSHVRAYVDDMGQVEVDDLYLGVNTDGEWFCIPLEAKPASPGEQLGRIQISSMVAYAEQEFPELPTRPIGVKMMDDGSILFVEFTATSDPTEIKSRFYKRYRLVRETD